MGIQAITPDGQKRSEPDMQRNIRPVNPLHHQGIKQFIRHIQ